MAFRHSSNNELDVGLTSKVRVLEQLMVRHYADPGFDKLELRRFGGRHGFVPTGQQWVDDGQDAALEDDDGGIILIGGERPSDLATQIIDTARAHSDESGKRQNYKITASRRAEGEQGTTVDEMVFELPLPAALFEETEQPTSSEQHDVVMASWNQLTRQNDFLFRMIIKILERWPDVMGKGIDLIEQLGDMLGSNGNTNTDALLKILEHERDRESRWMHHDFAKARSGHRAEMFGKALEFTAPDIMALLRKFFDAILARVQRPGGATSGNEGASSGDGTSQPSGAANGEGAKEPKSLGLASRLERALASAPPAGIRKARELLTEAEWDLLEAAQHAPTDEEFRAVFSRWIAEFRKRPKEEASALLAQLMMCLGSDATHEITSLIQIVQS